MSSTMTPAREGTRGAATINNARIPDTFKNEPSVDWSNPENQRKHALRHREGPRRAGP